LGGEIRTEKSDHRRANQKVLEHEILPPKKLDYKNTKRRLRLTGRLAPFRFHFLPIQRDSPGGFAPFRFHFSMIWLFKITTRLTECEEGTLHKSKTLDRALRSNALFVLVLVLVLSPPRRTVLVLVLEAI
jgi:hypothetical protein